MPTDTVLANSAQEIQDRLSKCMVLQIAPRVGDPMFKARLVVSTMNREIVSRWLEFTLTESDRPAHLLLTNSSAACSSKFFNSTLAHSMLSQEAVIEQSIGI
jgi:hypothetical protein